MGCRGRKSSSSIIVHVGAEKELILGFGKGVPLFWVVEDGRVAVVLSIVDVGAEKESVL